MNEMLLTALYCESPTYYRIEYRMLEFCVAKYKIVGLDEEVLDSIIMNYFMGFITFNEFVCQTLDIYTQKYGAITLPSISL